MTLTQLRGQSIRCRSRLQPGLQPEDGERLPLRSELPELGHR